MMIDLRCVVVLLFVCAIVCLAIGTYAGVGLMCIMQYTEGDDDEPATKGQLRHPD